MSAYNKAIAGESVSDQMKMKWDAKRQVFNGITHRHLERYARTVAYKVAYNLENGHKMDRKIDPLKYGKARSGRRGKGVIKMDKKTLDERITEADIKEKIQHTELLKAQTRRENAEAIRIEKATR